MKTDSLVVNNIIADTYDMHVYVFVRITSLPVHNYTYNNNNFYTVPITNLGVASYASILEPIDYKAALMGRSF